MGSRTRNSDLPKDDPASTHFILQTREGHKARWLQLVTRCKESVPTDDGVTIWKRRVPSHVWPGSVSCSVFLRVEDRLDGDDKKGRGYTL